MRFDNFPAADVVRPVFAFHENLGKDLRDEILRFVLIEDHHKIHRAQRAKHIGAVAFGIDRPLRSLVAPADRTIAVQADAEGIALGTREGKVGDMAAVKNVETPVREDQFLALRHEAVTLRTGFRGSQDPGIHHLRASSFSRFARMARISGASGLLKARNVFSAAS